MAEMRLKLRLQMFAEGGEGSAAGAADAGAQAGVQPESPAPENKRQKRNPLQNVKYGRQLPEQQAEEQQQDAQAQVAAAQTESFDELIRGKYKQDFDARVQAIVQDRLKNSKKSDETLSKLQPVLQMLGSQYGIDASDISSIDADAFAQKVLDDRKYYEQEAAEKGIPIDAYMKMKRVERENDMLRRQGQQYLAEQQRREQFGRLMSQFEDVKQVYPQADFKTEMENPAFGRLVANGVDARTAYEVIHRDEIQRGAMQYAVQRTKEQVAASMAANSRRPVENGNTATPASITKEDPSTWTAEDRREIRRRVQNGERIFL